jgi:hypothetical protein
VSRSGPVSDPRNGSIPISGMQHGVSLLCTMRKRKVITHFQSMLAPCGPAEKSLGHHTFLVWVLAGLSQSWWLFSASAAPFRSRCPSRSRSRSRWPCPGRGSPLSVSVALLESAALSSADLVSTAVSRSRSSPPGLGDRALVLVALAGSPLVSATLSRSRSPSLGLVGRGSVSAALSWSWPWLRPQTRSRLWETRPWSQSRSLRHRSWPRYWPRHRSRPSQPRCPSASSPPRSRSRFWHRRRPARPCSRSRCRPPRHQSRSWPRPVRLGLDIGLGLGLGLRLGIGLGVGLGLSLATSTQMDLNMHPIPSQVPQSSPGTNEAVSK